MMDLPDDAVVVAEIRIVKVFTAEAQGGEAIYVDYPDSLSLLDALGMISFALHTTPHTYGAFDEGEDE